MKCAGSRPAFFAEKLNLAMKVQYLETTHKINKIYMPDAVPASKAFPDWVFSVYQGKGTRKRILTRIMVSRSEIDMKRIKDEYKKNYSTTLYQDILVSKYLTTENDNKLRKI